MKVNGSEAVILSDKFSVQYKKKKICQSQCNLNFVKRKSHQYETE